jgi:protocatechuate 3,4-dioxygenase, beta subunit
MERSIESRRDFLRHASLALALPLVFGCRSDSSAQTADNTLLAAIKKNANQDTRDEYWGARSVPADVSWRTRLATPDDEGDRIIINGTIYKSDGKAVAANTLIYLYHTDVYGIYGRRDKGEHRHGRHRGWMLTDANGRYEFESILPASYPDSTIAKHIHMTLTTIDKKEESVDSILFEGDKFLTTRDREIHRGGFDPVLKMVKGSDGILRGVRDIRLWSV